MRRVKTSQVIFSIKHWHLDLTEILSLDPIWRYYHLKINHIIESGDGGTLRFRAYMLDWND